MDDLYVLRGAVVQVDFDFEHNGRLCGTHDAPGGDPEQLVARLP
jgi:hypothetical protein